MKKNILVIFSTILIYLQVGDDNETHYKNIDDATSYMRNIPNDVTIISGDNEEIRSNKYILSIFSSPLRTLLSTSSTILFPECSTFSIKYLLDMITNGFVVTEKLSHEEMIEITETAQLLSIKMGELYHDKIVPSSVRTNKVATRPMTRMQSIDELAKSNDCLLYTSPSPRDS